MEDLDLLELEAATIWGDDLGPDTVSVVLVDGHGGSRVLTGRATAGDDRPVAASLARGWLLTPSDPTEPPSGLRVLDDLAPDPDTGPPTGWAGEHWSELTRGTLGPWVALADGDRVVSLAHAARWTERATEVGVQTEPDVRGRGLARWVVARWSGRVPADRLIFYSALADNPASHRVAASLPTRPLGLLSRIGLA